MLCFTVCFTEFSFDINCQNVLLHQLFPSFMKYIFQDLIIVCVCGQPVDSISIHCITKLILLIGGSNVSISAPVLVQVRGGHRVAEGRGQLLSPEDVLRHQSVHVILLQEHHSPCVIGPRCPRHEGQLPEAHYPHGGVHGEA